MGLSSGKSLANLWGDISDFKYLTVQTVIYRRSVSALGKKIRTLSAS